MPGNSSDGPDDYHGDTWRNSLQQVPALLSWDPQRRENFLLYVHPVHRLGQSRLSIGPVEAAEPRREACDLGPPGLWQVSGSTEMLMRDDGSERAPG